MANSIKDVTVTGNLGRDAKFGVTAGGTSCVEISVASTKYRKNPQGGFDERVTWIPVKFYGRLADRMRTLAKGDYVVIKGELETDIWEDRVSGAKRSKMYVVGTSCEAPLRRHQAQQTTGTDLPRSSIARDDAMADIQFDSMD